MIGDFHCSSENHLNKMPNKCTGCEPEACTCRSFPCSFLKSRDLEISKESPGKTSSVRHLDLSRSKSAGCKLPPSLAWTRKSKQSIVKSKETGICVIKRSGVYGLADQVISCSTDFRTESETFGLPMADILQICHQPSNANIEFVQILKRQVLIHMSIYRAAGPGSWKWWLQF